MRLKSLTLSGFKSFPDRTRLDFGPGVSVVVGPNGSGKSNVTDAVLWALGEQSPLAVRGASMQDVIFAGGRGVQPRSAAEVEVVLDNSDGTVDIPLSEISIVRRLDRNGEGGYQLNGARCRLTDILEVLSDTGLGKETHSVISQGRVDAIVTSKPRDRRLLIEEAAGLGKHRKRRRRAQLKLERTQENVDRALDVEREARSRLRPLKRQAEAARLHERLERQILDARRELLTDRVRARREELRATQARSAGAHERRAAVEARLHETLEARHVAEQALAEQAARRERLSRRSYEARAAGERLQMRREQVARRATELEARVALAAAELGLAPAPTGAQAREHEPHAEEAGGDVARHAQERIAEFERQLAEVDAQHGRGIESELAELNDALTGERERLEHLQEQGALLREALERGEQELAAARERLAASEQDCREARRERERLEAELAAVNQFLHDHARARSAGGAPAFSEELRVADGFELALAAALGGRLDAALAEGLEGAQALLDTVGPDGGTVLLSRRSRGGDPVGGSEQAGAPAPGARRLLELVAGPGPVLDTAARLLSDAWVVERLEDLPESFRGVAVTRGGRVWFADAGEVRQVSAGGSERVLARRNERDRLARELAAAEDSLRAAEGRAAGTLGELSTAEAGAARSLEELRAHERGQVEAQESVRRNEWLIEQRRAAPAHGPLAVRKAQLEGELAGERRQLQAAERELAERQTRRRRLQAQYQRDEALCARAARLLGALDVATDRAGVLLASLEERLGEDRRAGERGAGELTAFATREAGIQAELKEAGQAVTDAEVATQRARDHAGEAELELAGVLERLGGSEPETQDAPEPLDEDAIAELLARVGRLERRREQLGPVNPLAQQEYAEALAHVEELEGQRGDLETAMRELRALIRETDRQIEQTFEETFSAAARNFAELVGEVFPGGTGHLRLVEEEQSPRGVLGGEQLTGQEGEEGPAEDEDGEEPEEIAAAERTLPGVEIEITPAGKSTKRLTLLSGGEKSMTALAFLFAVFLARPCPFYILDEVEAALDDLNLDRFLALLRRYCGRAQFIVITHQKRTMEAADWLFGVSMGQDGVSKVISRHLEFESGQLPEIEEVAEVA
ncbi:MAG TPA: AAA family ATPase [Solirubrobacteraceae bacterium]|nr:AAA family ATPase [Solirubrobacteraceae bacterium]